MSAKRLKKGATYDDLVRVPENFVAEMFDGELYASPNAASSVGAVSSRAPIASSSSIEAVETRAAASGGKVPNRKTPPFTRFARLEAGLALRRLQRRAARDAAVASDPRRGP